MPNVTNKSTASGGSGRRLSDEHRRKLSEAGKRRYQRERAGTSPAIRGTDGGVSKAAKRSDRATGQSRKRPGVDDGSGGVEIGAGWPAGGDGGDFTASPAGWGSSGSGTGGRADRGEGAAAAENVVAGNPVEGVEPEPELPPEPEPRPYRASPPEIDLDELKKRAGNAGMLSLGLTAAFHGLAMWRGQHWVLTEKEALYLATDLNNTITALLPAQYVEFYNEVLAKYSPVIGLCISASAIIGKRLAIDAELDAAKARPNQNGKQPTGDAGARAAGSASSAGFAGHQAGDHLGAVPTGGQGAYSDGLGFAW